MSSETFYRQGRSQARNVYRHGPDDPEDGEFIGVFFDPEDARIAVEAMNMMIGKLGQGVFVVE